MKALAKKQNLILHDKFASEIWSIGLTALSYATGGETSIYYDWSAKQIRYQLILAELHRLASYGFSKPLINLFKHLLSFNEKERPTLERISSCFSKQQTATSLFDDNYLSRKPQAMRFFLPPAKETSEKSKGFTQQSLIDFAEADLSPVRRIDLDEFMRKNSEVVDTK